MIVARSPRRVETDEDLTNKLLTDEHKDERKTAKR